MSITQILIVAAGFVIMMIIALTILSFLFIGARDGDDEHELETRTTTQEPKR